MAKEIGSEFWEVDTSDDSKLVIDKEHRYLLTGRTALDFIIKDLRLNRKLKSAYLPSYCCHTMIQPFLDNGIDVEFYDICFQGGKFTYNINFQTNCDVILIMQYFGFHNSAVGQGINKLKESGRIIIEDSTHSWFLENAYNKHSDYVFASFRKWTGLPCGAIALRQQGGFSIQEPATTNKEYIKLREQAAALKRLYIDNNIGEKEVFLKSFSKAEEDLELDYKNYNVPNELKELILTLDSKSIKHRRRLNAKYLIEKLKKLSGVETIIQRENDVPLFVPIIVQNKERDKLRQYLITNNIYCPVHWPLSREHRIKNTYLSENSLSIVCDQRYSTIDMERIINKIYEFYGG